ARSRPRTKTNFPNPCAIRLYVSLESLSVTQWPSRRRGTPHPRGCLHATTARNLLVALSGGKVTRCDVIVALSGHRGHQVSARGSTAGSLSVHGGEAANMSARTPEAEPLLTPAEVATMFRVDPKTVTRWAKAG